MIKYVTGDILLTKAQVLAHGVAPNDDFKQGLALTLREQWPAMYKDFRHFCHTKKAEEGDLWSWKGAEGPVIANLFTQEAPKSQSSHPGKASTSHVNHALRALKKDIEKNSYTSVAVTRIATGVGGLNWDDVKPLIESNLGGLEIPVYVYEHFQKGTQAAEA